MERDTERAERLREMGLGPVWRVRPEATRTPASDAAERSAADDSSGVIAAAAPLAAPAAHSAASPSNAREAEIAGLSWEELAPHIARCEACGLCRTRRKTVPGVGAHPADWLLVGEAPGAEEDAQGEPFVGQAGRLLDAMLRAVGLERGKAVHIANVLKCRPPGNRNPEPGEVARCAPYLERQIELLQPKLIIALGRFAAMTLLDTDATIASLRGRVHVRRGIPLIVTYHPAYLLRSLPDKAKAWEDLVLAKRTFAGLQNAPASPT